MNNSNEFRYLNFPIQLLQGFLKDPDKCLYNVLAYSIFNHIEKFNRHHKEKLLQDSLRYFKINIMYDEELLEDGEMIFNSIPENSPKVGLNTNIFNDYYCQDKDDFEKLCLLAFLSIKSILGRKPFVKMQNEYWFSRMDGNVKSCSKEELSDEIKEYFNDYQARKIKEELVVNWGLKTYSRYVRGFYVSFESSINQLVLNAEKKRKSYLIKKKKEEEKEAIMKALKILNT